MATPASANLAAAHAPADAQAIAAALRELRARIDAIADVTDALRPLIDVARQAPALAAMAGDSFDELMRTAADQGIDVERGVLNGTSAALRFGAAMDAEKVLAVNALLQSGVLDPAALRIIGELGRALVETASETPSRANVLGLLKRARDPNVQRALGFLVVFAERFGRRLATPPSASTDGAGTKEAVHADPL